MALTDNPIVGGSLAAASPFVDAFATHIEENYYQKREDKWKEFLADADMFLDNYHELLGIIKGIKAGELGKVNQSFEGLKEKVNTLLNEYDQADENGEKNGEIDLEELIAQRAELAQSLDNKKSKLWEIVNAMKELEKKVTAYRQGISLEREMTDNSEKVNNQSENHHTVNVESHQQAQILQPTNLPHSTPSSSK